MSLLEDVFLADEAGEANELERIIEGDGFDDRPRSEASNSENDSEKEDEAAEEKKRVDPAKPKRVVKNPRFILNPARLTGPRGIQVLPDHFKDFKFKGKGHEREDLDLLLKKLEHWAYRLYPKFQFEDCLKKIETLGKKRPVMVHLHKIRTDQFTSEETVVQKDSSDDEETPQADEFDILLQQQIELARATPAPGSVKKQVFGSPTERSLTMPKATSSPSINDEQRERMIRNRMLAEERRLAKLKQTQNDTTNTETVNLTENTHTSQENVINLTKNNEIMDKHDVTTGNKSVTDQENIINLTEDTNTKKRHNKSNIIDSSDEENDITERNNVINLIEDNVTKKKLNKSNVIDSSDEDEAIVMNQSVTVDVHDNSKSFDYGKDENNDKSDFNGIDQHNDKGNDDELNPDHNIIEQDNVNDRGGNNDKQIAETSEKDSSHNGTDEDHNIEKSDDNDNLMIDTDEQNINNDSTQITNNVNDKPDVNTENLIGKETKDNGKEDVDNDLMDVDFSDDF